MGERLMTGRVRRLCDLPTAPFRDRQSTSAERITRMKKTLEISQFKQAILAIRDTDPVPELSEAGGQRITDSVLTYVDSDILLRGVDLGKNQLPGNKDV